MPACLPPLIQLHPNQPGKDISSWVYPSLLGRRSIISPIHSLLCSHNIHAINVLRLFTDSNSTENNFCFFALLNLAQAECRTEKKETMFAAFSCNLRRRCLSLNVPNAHRHRQRQQQQRESYFQIQRRGHMVCVTVLCRSSSYIFISIAGSKERKGLG